MPQPSIIGLRGWFGRLSRKKHAGGDEAAEGEGESQETEEVSPADGD